MKAQIYINRQVMAANKKATKETGELVDKPAIAVNTYKGSIYCKEVEFTRGGKLIQDAEQARCSGATVWIEVNDFESLVIDGLTARNSMFDHEEPLLIEDYFWQFVEDFKAVIDDNYIAIARRLSSKYAADKQALLVMFKELQEKLQQKLDRDELELDEDDFDDLTDSIIGLGKKRYYSVLRNPRSALSISDSIKNCYIVLDLLN
ncbi:hypothetical protein [Myxosarcina sp. GI1]|uniref:hypothetical protein n=1 Tax=Myxosarcina sp. GI1 TaxID=1541065 RepID=UPI00055E3D99|nr:hypothetical protein [Myxosarcina sp. GI1]